PVDDVHAVGGEQAVPGGVGTEREQGREAEGRGAHGPGCYRPYVSSPTCRPMLMSRPLVAYPRTVAPLAASTSTCPVAESATSRPVPGSVSTTTPGPSATPTEPSAPRVQRAPPPRSTTRTLRLSAVRR